MSEKKTADPGNLGRPPNSREGWDEMRRRGGAGLADDRMPEGVFTQNLSEENKKEFTETAGVSPEHFDMLYNQLYEHGLAQKPIHLAATEALVLGKWLTRSSLKVSAMLNHIAGLEALLGQAVGPPKPEPPPTMH